MSKFEIESHELLVLARASIAKSEQNLAESEKLHDAVLESNRQLTIALAMLLPKSLRPEMTNSTDALSDAEENAVRIKEVIAKRDVMDVLFTIQLLGVANADIVEVDAGYHGHVCRIEISLSKRVEGGFSHENRLFSLGVYLDHNSDDENRNQLLAAESQIIKIITQLREVAVEVEVNA